MCQHFSEISIGLPISMHVNSLTSQSKFKEDYHFSHIIDGKTEVEALTTHQRMHGQYMAELGYGPGASGFIVQSLNREYACHIF